MDKCLCLYFLGHPIEPDASDVGRTEEIRLKTTRQDKKPSCC